MSVQSAESLSSVVVRPLAAVDITEVWEMECTTPGAPHWRLSDYEDCLHPASGALQRWACVAESGHQILGFAVVRGVGFGRGLQWEVESIVVRPKEQRRGVGKLLLSFVIRRITEYGACTLSLEVRASNVAALRLYERQGLARVGLRPAYYSNPLEDAVIMELKFPACQPL